MTAIGGRVDVATRRGVLGVSVLLPMLVVGLSSSGLAQESPCDAELLPLALGPHGYKFRGDRCEGIYVQQVSAKSLFLASLTESFEDFNLLGSDLTVEWAAPGDGTIRLRALGLKWNLAYRMDTQRPLASGVYSWSLGILSAQQIKRDDVGVVGTTRSFSGVDDDVYVPLRIRQQDTARCGPYQLVLWPSVSLKEVFISVAPMEPGRTPGPLLRTDSLWGPFPAEQAIRLKLGEPGPTGIYYLDIGARTVSGAPVTIQHWIYHAGACGS